MKRKKDWKYIIWETLLEIMLIIVSLIIFFKFDVNHIAYTFLGISFIVLVVIARIYLESLYK